MRWLYQAASIPSIAVFLLACASSGSSTSDEQLGTPPTGEHTVKYAVTCGGSCKSSISSGIVFGRKERTTTCTHGQQLSLSATPQVAREGENGSVSVTIWVDGDAVANGSRAVRFGENRTLIVRAICE